uniref:Uncharacterized protein n=1 Tax=Rhizophora mucronata TaxID=61149 RepID=A0A2P2QHR9_RHIMU
MNKDKDLQPSNGDW